MFPILIPNHCKKNIRFTLAQRISGKSTRKIKASIRIKRKPKVWISCQYKNKWYFKKALEVQKNELRRKTRKQTNEVWPFIFTLNPSNPTVYNTIKNFAEEKK